MPTPKESFAHGEHNEKACLLMQAHDFLDWTITTAFYASLHFVTSKIFPFKYTSPDGATTITFNDIAEWQKFKNYTSNKRHTLISELVGKHCSKICDEYEWLLNASWNARYHSHIHHKEVVNRAIDYMSKIKAFCAK